MNEAHQFRSDNQERHQCHLQMTDTPDDSDTRRVDVTRHR